MWEPVTAKRKPHTDHKWALGCLDRIKDNPKSVIKTWQSIRNKLMPQMADVDTVSTVELFGAHLTGAAAREFVQILFDCIAKLYVDTLTHRSMNNMQNGPSQIKLTPYSKDLLSMH